MKFNGRSRIAAKKLPVGLVLVLLLAGGMTWWFRSHSKGPPNIIVITLESVRPDHMAGLGGSRVTCANLDALVRESMVYENAYSVTSWTLSAHASLFTGLYPTSHKTKTPSSKLDDSYTTLAEILTEQGYQCAGVISGPYLRKAHNLHQGFEFYDESAAARGHHVAHDDVTNPQMEKSLRDFIKNQRDRLRPLFLFAYFWDPHYDYIPPAPYNRMFVGPDCEQIDITKYELSDTVNANISKGQLAYVISQYDGEIRWTDEHLGRLFQLLKEEDLWDNTLLIVTADHGEEFFEHGQKGHYNNIYTENVHVPLIIKYPQGTPRGRDSRLVSLIDILPTVLEVAEITTSILHQGYSLLTAPKPDRPIFYELLLIWYDRRTVEEWFAIRQGDYKLISVSGKKRIELYNIKEDPQEMNDLFGREKTRERTLMKILEQWHKNAKALAENFHTAGGAELNDEAIERLRSLGYIK